MYPLQCTAGYAMPVKSGKMEIFALSFNLTAVSTAYELSIWDTPVNAIIDPDNPPAGARKIFHINGAGSESPFITLPESLKTRSGIAVGDISNVEAGELYIYVR